MITKICPRCNQEKNISSFTFNKRNNRYSTTCKTCCSIATKTWQSKLFKSTSPEDILEATFIKINQTSRTNAKSKNLPFTLSIQDIRDLYKKQEGKCYYTNVPMTLRTKDHLHRDPLLISLDRLDSTLGYTKENTVFCCWSVNALKGPHSIPTFYQILELLYTSAKQSNKM